MKPTLQDIAHLAGVSLSTVSLVLSHKGKISASVREKVRATAKELGYKKYPATPAEKAFKIVILFHFDHNLAHTWNMLRQVTVELQSHLEKNNYLTLLIPITYDMQDDEIFNKVIASGATAVFSMHFGRESLFARLEDASIPVAVIINSQFQSKFHTICADNFQGSYDAASHLINLGHRNIIYAEFDIYQLPMTLSDRFLGFYKAIQEFGVTFPEENRLHLDIQDSEGIKNSFRSLLTKPQGERPTAVFFIDDYLSAHCLAILKDLGFSSPADISIIAAGEVLDYNEPFVAPITTMRTNPALLGKFSAEMIFNILESAQESNHVLKIKQQLIERGSCRKIC
ncbi:LacI family DNA-binding transcriptional regulator [Treponema primitia]|uniref:LacI family DNA-binding transcriptional regulator n=1 Tax=Treponema primitia TaxID=88058 RepID=UPI00025557AE|nr:LacI family DNA-binding transcriptional regulator [Treponema primitia]